MVAVVAIAMEVHEHHEYLQLTRNAQEAMLLLDSCEIEPQRLAASLRGATEAEAAVAQYTALAKAVLASGSYIGVRQPNSRALPHALLTSALLTPQVRVLLLHGSPS